MLPKQGPAAPWLMAMDYHEDRKQMRHGDVADEHLRFSSRSVRTSLSGARA